jgi:hypothetical protein
MQARSRTRSAAVLRAGARPVTALVTTVLLAAGLLLAAHGAGIDQAQHRARGAAALISVVGELPTTNHQLDADPAATPTAADASGIDGAAATFIAGTQERTAHTRPVRGPPGQAQA